MTLDDGHTMRLQFPLGLKDHRTDVSPETGDDSVFVKGLSNAGDGIISCK